MKKLFIIGMLLLPSLALADEKFEYALKVMGTEYGTATLYFDGNKSYGDIKANEIPLKKTNKFSYLGVIIDENLRWNHHIKKLSNKSASATGILNKIKHIIHQQYLILLYNALILPYLN